MKSLRTKIVLMSLLWLLNPLTWETGVIHAAFGQRQIVDSLKRLSAQTPLNDLQTLLLTELAANYQFFNADTAIILTRQAVDIATRNHFPKGAAAALTRLGEVYRLQGEYPQALEAHLKALSISRDTDNQSEEANTLSFAAIVYVELGEYRQGLNYLLQAERIFRQNPYEFAAYKPFSKQHAYAGFRLSNIGDAYQKLGMLDSALYFQHKALATPWTGLSYLPSQGLRALILERLGDIKYSQNDLHRALLYDHQALITANRANDLLNKARSKFQLAQVYYTLNRVDSSLHYARGAFRDTQKAGQKLLLLSASQLLAQLFKSRNQLDSAYYFKELASGVKDSLFGPDKFRRLQVLFLNEQQRNNLLHQEQEQSKNRMQRLFLLVGLGVSFLIAIVLWRSNRLKQRAYRTLNRQNKQVQEQRNVLKQTLDNLKATQAQLIEKERMTALRAQMNPHFIFNCLNSIKLYTLENDADRASEYLTKFSRLIRIVLENSRSERVTLHNELDMLRLYADMETMRFKQKLSFFVEVEPGVDADFIEIPPLLLQPYVENAIWHGLMHKPEGGTVRVRASQLQENLLQLTITDDGVGRARAAELKSKSANHRKSFGLKMTSERIALVNQLYQTHTQVEIQDLVDTDGQPAGTEVIIQIPI